MVKGNEMGTSSAAKAANLGFSSASVADLDTCALEQAGQLGGIGSGYEFRTDYPANGDWGARWIATFGMVNCGRLVLVPLSARTRKIFRTGTIRLWVRSGLTEQQASILYNMPYAKYRFELASFVAVVFQNRNELIAYMAHPLSFGPGSGRLEWYEKYKPVLSFEPTVPREVELAKMVWYVVRMGGG